MKRIDTINVIPFIDIMLVLLAIVLTTATFIAKGVIQVDLPETALNQGELSRQTRYITISPEGSLYFDETLRTIETLRQDLQGLTSETPVVVRADREVRFGLFIEVVELLKLQGLENLSIVTKRVPQ